MTTALGIILHNTNIEKVILAGCATDMAVQAAARDAHDRDYAVSVVADCCIAANDEDHTQTLRMLAKIARVEELGLLSLQSDYVK